MGSNSSESITLGRPGRRFQRAVRVPILGLALLLAGSGGCSFRRMAVDNLGDALSGSGSTFAADDDPELVREAIPFGLKLMESLLTENPNHEGLLLAATKGFTQFAVGFIQQEAEILEDKDVQAAENKRNRARKLLLRARGYGLRGLELASPGFAAALKKNPKEAVAKLKFKDVSLLYWTTAAWGSAIGVSKQDPDLIADQVMVEAMIDRALALDETFDRGAIHGFLIAYEMVRQGGDGTPAARSLFHFNRAVALSKGLLAAPYVAYAESVAVQVQDVAQFKSMLHKALAIDPNAVPDSRLANLLLQERARWLLSRVDDLFLIPQDRKN